MTAPMGLVPRPLNTAFERRLFFIDLSSLPLGKRSK